MLRFDRRMKLSRPCTTLVANFGWRATRFALACQRAFALVGVIREHKWEIIELLSQHPQMTGQRE